MAPMGRAPRLPPEQMGALQGTSLEESPREREIHSQDPHHEGSLFG